MEDEKGEIEEKEKIFKCSGCGGTLQYAPGTTNMKCPYCGTEQSIGQSSAAVREHDFSELELAASTKTEGFGIPSRHFKCDRCGAITSLPESVTATKCNFCDSPIVIESPPVKGMVTPESLVPFVIDKNSAVSKYSQWLQELWFRPSDLKRKAALSDIHGLYVPHFTFDANASSQWSGQAGYYYYETESYTTTINGKSVRQTRKVQKIRWETHSGTHDEFYDDVLVCASKGLHTNIMQKIYPYNLNALAPYKPEYLSGFLAEAYTINPRDAWQTGMDEMKRREVEACKHLLGGDVQRDLNVNTKLSNAKWKHLLLPVYVASYAYGKRIYRFMVNGQTGEVQGEAPWSWMKIAAVAAGIAIAAAVICKLVGVF